MRNDDLRQWFGENAESIIQSKGMTKKAVSEKAGIPYSTFNFMLRGKRSVTLDDVLSIAEATESNPSAFLPDWFKGTPSSSDESTALADEEVTA